ncbi:MAG: ribonucleoside-diphosphate reductase, adenosylcobalamin-dependent [Omnitrophica WOR_2 bacterium RIFCSPLOWO2_02_FULL_50_19]|nr:MAG: ribonucleoside-diphosphate reductase, adenosylcobalamin-dependent [Omnitrophica WOR_2 bacterium RIFCSPLOWO2_02_FULL_50_19]
MGDTRIQNGLSANSRKVLEKRYLRKDSEGRVIETPEELCRRIAHNIASADSYYDPDYNVAKLEDEFYAIIYNLDFLPNSPTLMNAGRELQQLSACFVLPVEDSMESIFEAIKNTALIHRSGGGTGFSFSRLRPANSMVKTTGGIASGPVSFMKVFDAATHAVKQGGTRRGANMGILRIDHPDILDFIKCKEADRDITNFNISVAITEEFMKKVERDEEYDLIAPHTKKSDGQLKAREVFDMIIRRAWKNGEPGIVFIDRINKSNPTPKLGVIESTNPCGEQPLLPYESCNLGSINLSKMVTTDTAAPQIDWEKLRRTTKLAVHFLDNVIDMNKFPLPQIETMTKANRKIGLGVMGFAEMLIKLSVAYNSEEAIELAEKIISFIQEESRRESHSLALRRGSFPNFSNSIYLDGPSLRNATLTTIAPTGTLSILADTSSGIEPVFAISYYREVMDKTKLVEVNKLFEDIARERGFYSEELMQKIAEKGTLHDIDEVPEDVKRIFVTAHDITPIWHIRMQAAFQKYTDNAVSKTVNFPHNATPDDVREVYLLAYKMGCKGVTIYRDGSREEQVLYIARSKEKPSAEAHAENPEVAAAKIEERSERARTSPRPRPEVTRGTTTKILTGCGNLYITINEDENEMPFEVFTQMGKAGGCAASQLEAIGRLVSLALRCGLDTHSIIEQLNGIRCPNPSWEKGGRIFSCADAIAKVVERRLLNKKAQDVQVIEPEVKTDEVQTAKGKNKLGNVVGVCPDCGGALQHVEGCMVCKACGYSKC